MTEDVCVAVVCSNAKVRVIRSIPLIFDGFDKQSDIPEPELDRALVGFVTGVAFDLDFHHFDSEYHVTRRIPRTLGMIAVSGPTSGRICYLGVRILMENVLGELVQGAAIYEVVAEGDTGCVRHSWFGISTVERSLD